MKSRLILFFAQGLGIGRVPFAPGTFGTLLGFGLLALFLWFGSWWGFAMGILVSTLLSVWLSGKAEKILKKKDPGSVVIDEIIAIPISSIAWLAWHHDKMPGLHSVFIENWPLLLAVFVLFRFFDILKPWPVGKSQSLPGGWGVTIDDVLAGVYVNIVIVGYLLIVK